MRKEKINPNRWIIERLFDVRRAALHGITRLHLLLLLLSQAALPYATAQPGTGFSNEPYGYQSNVNPSLAVIIISLVCAFFFVGLFALYLRQCTDSSAVHAAVRQAGGGGGRSRRVNELGLDTAVIETFPIFIYAAVKDHKIGKGALECAVCLNEFEDDDSLRLLPKCDHVFHPHCIDAWLTSHTTCPVCRANLIPESGGIPGDAARTRDLDELRTEENPRLELSEVQNQVSITVNEDQNRESQVAEIPKQNRPPRSKSTTSGRIFGKFPRSHSTGHSLVQPGERNFERYTLRLPEEVRKQMAMSLKLKRETSCHVVLPREGSSRKGYGSGGEGSGKRKAYLDRQLGRSDRGSKSDRWVFSKAPPFLSRLASLRSLKSGGDGDVTAAAVNGKTFITSVKGPLDCLSVNAEGAEQTSARPAV